MNLRAEINGVGVEYRIDGDRGPWLVMSHSLGCSISMWDAQVPALAGSYRVLRYDTRGHGGSGATPDAYTLDQLTSDALALMDHVGIERAVWVGFSMGGMIGQTLALKAPERLIGIVLADTTSQHGATPQSVWEERIRTAREQGMAPLVAPAVGRWFTPAFREAHPDVVARVAAQIAATSVDGWCGCCAAIAAVHTTDRLPAIGMPALVVVGEFDIGTPLESALTLQRGLPDATLIVVSDAAHMSCIEQPEQFNRALRMFLDARIHRAGGWA